jgi:UDP:flavonoid glycosyltransferase YjiC (YdhE family)
MFTSKVFKNVFFFKFLSYRFFTPSYNFPSDRYRSFEESLRNVSLLLLNTHFSTTQPRPYLPNVIEVGGLQVKPNPSPLPEDIKTFLDKAEHGAILFSLGSNVKSNYLSDETLSTILKVFSKIKQRVIMKWESDVLEGKPDNVFISKWLPQDDVLAHKNLKAFISHCGYGGLIEAKYHGVPIIGVPIFGDQPTNADIIVNEGWGIRIELLELTEEKLLKGIDEVINNSTYSTTVKRLSLLAKDRPMNAQETAVYWIEYVIRHNGAPHLHYPGADLNFFQDNSYDLIVFLVVMLYLIYRVFKFIILRLCRLCCKRGSKKQKTQ